MKVISAAALILLAPIGHAQTKPDRSGEQTLKAILTSMGKLRNCKAFISVEGREGKSKPMYPQRWLTLWLGSKPNQFRVMASEYWGGGALFVSDGKTLMDDPFEDQDNPINLRQAGSAIFDSHTNLAPKGAWGSVLFLLLSGPSSLERLVTPGMDIPAPSNGVLNFKTRDFGTMAISFIKSGDGLLATGVDYDNKPERQAQYRFNPLFSDPPDDPLTRETYTYNMNAAMPKGVFDTTPPKGRKIEDLRKKIPKPRVS